MSGWPFLLSLFYLTLAVAFVVTLLREGLGPLTAKGTARRWGKFLLLLVLLGAGIQVLTLLQG